MDWQPIETLPEPAPDLAVYGYMVRCAGRLEWTVYVRPPHAIPSAATHWMPLPNPPEVSA